MFGSSLFGGYENDPFFREMQATQQRHMQAMQGMFSNGPYMPPMMLPMMSPMYPPALEGGGGLPISRPLCAQPSSNPMVAMSPFGMMSMFGDMNSMMGNMQRSMERASSDPNAHSYSSSTVMSYSDTGDGAPNYYQASSSTRQAPGGIRETRKTVKDSHKGLEKMAIGHHIGDRAHVIEKSKDTKTGDMEEKQDFLNIEETQAEEFDSEWKQKTAGAQRGGQRSVAGGRSRPTMAALTDGREYRRDREQRPTRLPMDADRSVRFDRSERTSDDAQHYQRRPTPARPKGPSTGGRRRDTDGL